MRGFSVRPAGVPVLIVFDDADRQLWEGAVRAWGALGPELYEDARPRLARFDRVIVLSRRAADQVQALVGVGKEVTLLDSSDRHRAAERLTVEVTLHLLKERAGSAHLLHAAVLGDAASRRAFALVAPSGTGKTTAARFLGGHFTYLTDETAVVGSDLSVLPYPKPLSVIETAGRPKVQYNPIELGLAAAAPTDSSFTLKNLVILNRSRERAVGPEFEPMPLADALLEVVGQSSGLKRTSRGIGQMAELLNRVGGAVKLNYSEISEALPLFRNLVQGEYDAGGQREPATYVGPAVWSSGGQQGLYQRAQESDGLAVGQRFLISWGEQLSEVSAFAWDCWLALERPLSQQQLHQTIQQLYGPIPPQDFRQALKNLQDVGIISRLGPADSSQP